MRATSTARSPARSTTSAPSSSQNLLAIVWLYRGQTDRFLDLVADYLAQTLEEAGACFETEDETGRMIEPLADYQTALAELKRSRAALPGYAARRRGARGSAPTV